MSSYKDLRGRRVVYTGDEFSRGGRDGKLGFERLIDNENNVDDEEVAANETLKPMVKDDEEEEEALRNPYHGLGRAAREVEGSTRGSRIPQPKGTTCDEDNSGFYWLLTLLVMALIIIAAYLVAKDSAFFVTKSSTDLNEWQTFTDEFNSFKLKYNEVLPQIGFKVLSTSVKNVVTRRDTPSAAPAVVLFIASKENTNVLNCVERDFVETVNKAYNESDSARIDGKQTHSTHIVDTFDDNFDVQQKHTIVIENVDSIAAEDIMTLHQFTDHHNSRYTEAVIVLTAIHYQKIDLDKNAKPLDMDSIATQLFQMKWKNALKEEQRFALISRLTPSVVTIIGDDPNIKC